jgi:HAMP domain-containing protein
MGDHGRKAVISPPLRARIRNGTLLMLVLTLTIVAFAVPTVHRLGGSIRETLYRNYVSIEAAQHMHATLYAVELAKLQGRLPVALPASRDAFMHWMNVELGDMTEVGEETLAHDIQRRGRTIFDELKRSVAVIPSREEFGLLHQRLDDLIQLNKAAMFRADSRTMRISDRLAYEFAMGLMVLLALDAALSWTLVWSISKPLVELSEHLRSFSLRGPWLRLGAQPLAELQAVASEFNPMAERLEKFEKLNVDTGPGIPSEIRQRLFERFTQRNVNGAAPGAAGLGLAVAKETVEAHVGRIFVDSKVGKGTCFTVELPMAQEAVWQSS